MTSDWTKPRSYSPASTISMLAWEPAVDTAVMVTPVLLDM